jgi:adenine-specific DNA-methyltransferase
MKKAKMHTPNLTQENIARIRELFPNCVTEIKDPDAKPDAEVTVKYAIDFDLLKQELSGQIVEGPVERYQLNWPGKREALLAANAPIAKTLRPVREESVNFDTTENLFIEGDNLDALKLLQETYLGKVKMIYIDPPYNTGNDFIYNDDFAENSDEYLVRSNQKDEEGNRLVANSESNGRFHSDWLSMMYPRLKLARNLLSDDGVIFISIDDDEVHNLRKMCDEIFGEGNFVAALVWDKNRKNDAKYFSVGHEYMLVYFKSAALVKDKSIVFRSEKQGIDEVKEAFERLRAKYHDDWKAVERDLRSYYSSWADDDPRKPISRFNKVDSNGPYRDDGNIGWPGGGGPKYPVLHPLTKKECKVPDAGWRFPDPKRMAEEIEKGRVVFGPDETTLPRIRRNLFESDKQVMRSVNFSYAQTATVEFNKIFDGIRIFDNPKHFSDLENLIRYVGVEKNEIVLDFFAGGAATAHAVFLANRKDHANRKFILVQLPEECDPKSEACKAGYKTIADIAKERIRRAGKKIQEELSAKAAPAPKKKMKENTAGLFDAGVAENGTDPEAAGKASGSRELDIGFRVLKVDSSCMADVYYTPDQTNQQDLTGLVENIKSDRTEEDLLFQVLLDWGVDLSLPIVREKIEKLDVFFVDRDSLAACFAKDGKITERLVEQIAERSPMRVVFRDAGFKSDSVRINVEQIFKQKSPRTEIRTI